MKIGGSDLFEPMFNQTEGGKMHYTARLKKVIKGLKKATKLHAQQAKILEGIEKDQRLRYKKKPK
mgnify:FL=1